MLVPATLQKKPYAAKHFRDIAQWAAVHHPFYTYLHDSLANGAEVPLLTRERITDNNDLLLNGNPANGFTSGSVGMPVKMYWTPQRIALDEEDNLMLANWLGGPVPRMKIVSLQNHQKTNNTIDVITAIPEQIEFIQRTHKLNGAISLITYPTNIEQLCAYIVEHNIDMTFIKRVCCMSEVYEDYHDKLIGQAFPNALPTSTYSAVETGVIALRCPFNPRFHHVMAHKLGVEFLNEQNQPCEVGELGRIIITDYFNRAAPLIRYDIGDLAAPANCDCGQIALPAMENIVGKVRGTLRHRDGRRIMFTDFSVIFRDSPAVKQYQVIQEELTRFTIRFVPRPGADIVAFEERIHHAFKEQFGYDAQMDFVQEQRIERSPGGKFYASICKVI